MNNEIDVNEIMKILDQKIKTGLAEKRLTVTDISIMIGKHIEKAKEKILEDAGEIISEKTTPSNDEVCKECGKPLKKTKK